MYVGVDYSSFVLFVMAVSMQSVLSIGGISVAL